MASPLDDRVVPHADQAVREHVALRARQAEQPQQPAVAPDLRVLVDQHRLLTHEAVLEERLRVHVEREGGRGAGGRCLAVRKRPRHLEDLTVVVDVARAVQVPVGVARVDGVALRSPCWRNQVLNSWRE